MTRLILIRHGETDWNVEGRWQGQADIPLNESGRKQAFQIANALREKNITAIYTSDLCRARETAQILATATVLEVNIDPRLREIHQGKWQGLLITEIQEKYAEEFGRRKNNPLAVAPPGGETASQVIERVAKAIRKIVVTHPQETVAVVSHGFTIACLLSIEQNTPIDGVWKLVPENGAWQEIYIRPPA